MANQNSMDAYNSLDVADGALNESQSILQRLRELSLKSANGATNDQDREAIQTEANMLMDELNSIADTTQFNGQKILDGNFQASVARTEADVKIAKNAEVNVSSTQGEETNYLIKNVAVDPNNDKDVSFQVKLLAGEDNKMNASIRSSADGLILELEDIGNGANIDLSAQGYDVTIDLGKSTFEDIGKSSLFTINSAGSEVREDNSASYQTGPNQGQTMGVAIGDMSLAGLRIQGLDFTSQASAENNISMLDDALAKVSTQRAGIGAVQERLEHRISSNETATINQMDAESRIRDADFASETLELTKNNMLLNSGLSVLTQANTSSEAVLGLLG